MVSPVLFLESMAFMCCGLDACLFHFQGMSMQYLSLLEYFITCLPIAASLAVCIM